MPDLYMNYTIKNLNLRHQKKVENHLKPNIQLEWDCIIEGFSRKRKRRKMTVRSQIILIQTTLCLNKIFLNRSQKSHIKIRSAVKRKWKQDMCCANNWNNHRNKMYLYSHNQTRFQVQLIQALTLTESVLEMASLFITITKAISYLNIPKTLLTVCHHQFNNQEIVTQ